MRTKIERAPSLAGNDGLDLGMQRPSLSSLAADWAETFDSQLLACLLHGLHPFLQGAGRKCLLRLRGSTLAHHLAPLVLEQRALGQAAHGLLLPALEDKRFGQLALPNLANLHDLFHC